MRTISSTPSPTAKVSPGPQPSSLVVATNPPLTNTLAEPASSGTSRVLRVLHFTKQYGLTLGEAMTVNVGLRSATMMVDLCGWPSLGMVVVAGHSKVDDPIPVFAVDVDTAICGRREPSPPKDSRSSSSSKSFRVCARNSSLRSTEPRRRTDSCADLYSALTPARAENVTCGRYSPTVAVPSTGGNPPAPGLAVDRRSLMSSQSSPVELTTTAWYVRVSASSLALSPLSRITRRSYPAVQEASCTRYPSASSTVPSASTSSITITVSVGGAVLTRRLCTCAILVRCFAISRSASRTIWSFFAASSSKKLSHSRAELASNASGGAVVLPLP
eukprot:comp22162_c0_seq1/m.52020 comp22162_c0_seq1/g.52020  ORF comp22162_c0_seq1/g.52020 comp22162_c0_seq1/m.52020 type:complete len:330 (-) comp22162_c0_seq1:483-1472(-)